MSFVFSAEEEEHYDYDLDDEYGHYYDDHDDHEEEKAEKKSENMKNDMREFFGITKSFRSSKKGKKGISMIVNIKLYSLLQWRSRCTHS